jgi:hypothetical protein
MWSTVVISEADLLGGARMAMSVPEPGSWRTSTSSGGKDCIAVAVTRRAVLIRDSRDLDGPVLRLTASQWTALLSKLKQVGFGTPT